MILERRWQDWMVAAIGLLVTASPMIYGWGGTNGEIWVAGTAGAWAALVLGGLVFLSGVAGLVAPNSSIAAFAQVVAAVLLFFSPWLAGFAEAAWFAWTAWIAAVLVVVIAGTDFVVAGRRRIAAG